MADAESAEDPAEGSSSVVVWSAEENNRSLFTDPALVEANEAECEEAATGAFHHDYARACQIYGVLPHPQLLPPAAKGAGPAAEEAKDELKSPKSKGKDKKPAKAGEAEAEAVTTLRVGGWVLDAGTMTALGMAFQSCRSICSLKLWNASLDIDCLTILADSMQNSSVQKLYLDFNPIDEPFPAVEGQEGEDDDDAVPAPSIFASFITNDSAVQLLSLRDCGITTAKASSLFMNLRDNKTLMSLNLWGNQLTDPAMPDLSNALLVNKTLTHINLAKNQLGNEGATSLMRCLTSELVDKEAAKDLKKLNIPMSTVKGVTFRDPNQSLRVLNLSQNLIEDEGCTEVLYAVNPLARPSTPEPMESPPTTQKGKKDKGGKPEKIVGKDSKIETVAMIHNAFGLAVHKRLAAEPKVEVQVLPEGVAQDEEEEDRPTEETA